MHRSGNGLYTGKIGVTEINEVVSAKKCIDTGYRTGQQDSGCTVATGDTGSSGRSCKEGQCPVGHGQGDRRGLSITAKSINAVRVSDADAVQQLDDIFTHAGDGSRKCNCRRIVYRRDVYGGGIACVFITSTGIAVIMDGKSKSGAGNRVVVICGERHCAGAAASQQRIDLRQATRERD